jgi:hypothetical protein
MIARGANYKAVPLNIVGSSTFGRYPKISAEKTYNMFVSDNFLVPYPGYEIAVNQSLLGGGTEGRGIFASNKLNTLITVIGNRVYKVSIQFQPNFNQQFTSQQIFIGTIGTSTGVVYIAENNKPQILISDGASLYLYDPTISAMLQPVTGLDFQPGYITFHDTFFIAASVGTNEWRLSNSNDGNTWSSLAAGVGELQTKPDNTQAVVRFPSRGNMIFVMGNNVTESWFDTGAQLFPYQRNNQMNIDYGCVSPATVAYMDEIVVWLARNEKSGPVIMWSDGGMPEKITTDGIDFFFHQLANPEDSQAFLYRQDGHLIYHINFYTDNLSLFVDFNTKKIYHACDQNLDYFIASQLAYFNNQYYFVSKNTGCIYAFDTTFTTFQDIDSIGDISYHEIPRMRICKNIRLPTQENFIANDAGFTIETGETDYQRQIVGPIFLITQDGKFIATDGSYIYLTDEEGNFLLTQDGKFIVAQDLAEGEYLLISQQSEILNATPAVDLTISYDGGATFGNAFRYNLNPIGQRRNRLMWWQLGWSNDMVCQFKFWGLGRFVVTDGYVNIRQ